MTRIDALDRIIFSNWILKKDRGVRRKSWRHGKFIEVKKIEAEVEFVLHGEKGVMQYSLDQHTCPLSMRDWYYHPLRDPLVDNCLEMPVLTIILEFIGDENAKDWEVL